MCVLQDFEAVTPNLLARTIETVEGGGLVVLLLKTMSSLRQLYTMTMVRQTGSRLLLLVSLAAGCTFALQDIGSRHSSGSVQRAIYPVPRIL